MSPPSNTRHDEGTRERFIDNEPLKWIKDKIKIKRDDRPNAFESSDQVLEYKGDYCGSSYVTDDDDDDNYDDDNKTGDKAVKPSYADSDEGVIEGKELAIVTTKPIDQAPSSSLRNKSTMLSRFHMSNLIVKLFPSNGTLHHATNNRNKKMVEKLLDSGTDINRPDKDGWTSLHHAAHNGHDDMVQLLLEKGADVVAKDDNGWTPLHQVAYSGLEDMVQLLLEKGADMAAKDDNGATAMHQAAGNGQK